MTILAGAFVALLACAGETEPPGQLMGGTVKPPVPKAEFTLTDHHGDPFDFRKETDGFVTLLFFGYTYCPDVCPIHMSRIAAALDRLPTDVTDRVKTVFVSVDPERDTPERLRTWLANFHPSFIGVTGPQATIDGIVTQLGFAAAVAAATDSAGDAYGVSHPGVVIGYTRENVGQMMYFSGTPADVFVNDLPLLVGER